MELSEARGKCLVVTAEQVALCNSLLPPGTQVMAIRRDGQLYLGADLLTDAGPGGTYEAAASVLATLEVVDSPL